jgi:hypothetical protein
MFAFKLTELAKLKEKWQQQRELEAEVERMVSKLQTASPEIALQVEEMMLMSPRARKDHRRRGRQGDERASVKAPIHRAPFY